MYHPSTSFPYHIPLFYFFMDKYLRNWWDNGGSVIVKYPIYKGESRYLWLDFGWFEEVQCDFSMWDELAL